MSNWKIRSRFYHWFRHIFPVNIFYREEMDALIYLFDLIKKKNLKILDIGTGIGESLRYSPDGKFRILLDQSGAMLQKATSNSNDKKIHGKAQQLPFKKEQFDLVTCIGTCEYIKFKYQLMTEIYDVLKLNGYAIITFSPQNMLSKLRNLLGKRIYTVHGSAIHDLFAARGFFIVESSRTTMQTQFLIQKL